MPARECAEWAVLYAQEPFGDLRADLRAGIVASAVAAGYSSKPTRPRDFMPYIDAGNAPSSKPAPPQDDGARAAFLMASGHLPRRVVRRRAPAAPIPPRAKR